MKDIVVLGSVTADIFLRIPTHYSQDSSWTFPLGMKVPVQERQEFVGGGGANAARIIALHKDLSVHFPYCTGRDYWGEKINSTLQKQNIATYPHIVDVLTAQSYILYGAAHDSVVFTHKGANAFITVNETIQKLCKTSAGIFLAPIKSINQNETASFIDLLAKHASIPRLCIVHPAWDENIRTRVKETLSSPTMILSMNMSEAIAFWGLPPTIRFDECAIAIQKAMKDLQGLCVVTGGNKGAYCITNSECIYQESYATKIVSTVGAGDAFAATFFSGILSDLPLKESLILAARQSAYVMQDISTTGLAQNMINKSDVDAQ